MICSGVKLSKSSVAWIEKGRGLQIRVSDIGGCKYTYGWAKSIKILVSRANIYQKASAMEKALTNQVEKKTWPG